MAFRRYIVGSKKILTIVLISFLSLSFSEGVSHASALLDRVVAIVNKEVITWSELYKAMEFEISGSEMKALSDADKKRLFKESEAVFLESMIDRKLQLQAARALDIGAGKDEIQEAVEAIKKKYSMNEREFSESLKREGFSLEEYKKRLAEQIILSKVVGQQVRGKIVISPEEIKEYNEKNRDAGFRVRQIFFKRPEKDADRTALESKTGEVLRRLKDGEDFQSLARKYSEDPTGRAGGDLGFIKKDYLGKEFLEVVSRMAVGEVSRPFWTARGLHVIKLEEKVDASNTEESIEISKKKLFEKRFEEEYRNWIRSLREKAHVEVKL